MFPFCMPVSGMVSWLNLFSGELSLKRYWWGPRSQEVGEEGDYAYGYTVPTRMDSCSGERRFNASLVVRGQVT